MEEGTRRTSQPPPSAFGSGTMISSPSLKATSPSVRAALWLPFPATRRRELVELAASQGLQVAAVYEPRSSAAAKAQWREVVALGHSGVTVLAVSLRDLPDALQSGLALLELGMLQTLDEPWLQTRGAVDALRWSVEREEERRHQAVSEGIARAARAGRLGGRPRKPIPPEALAAVARGERLGAVARAFSLGESTLRRAVRAAEVLQPVQPHAQAA